MTDPGDGLLVFTHGAPGSPRRQRDARHQVNVRLSVEDEARLSRLGQRTGHTQPDLLRIGLRMLHDGYPNLTPARYDWLMTFAAANDLHGEPDAALDLLLDHLRKHHPAARRIVP